MATSETRPDGPLAAGPAIVRTIVLATDLALLTATTAGLPELAQRARSLRDRAAPLAEADAAAYRDFLATRSEEARGRTIELPLQMAELAADTTEVAAETALAAAGPVAGDATVGAMLAETAAHAAALLVRMNGGGEAAAGAADRAARAAAAWFRRER